MRILIAGDTHLQGREDPATAFDHVLAFFEQADLRIVNLEGCLSDPQYTIPHKAGWRQPERRMVTGLVKAHIDMVATANNVTFGAAPILESLETLDSFGIAHAGSGRTREEARRPATVTRDGVRVGMLSYTCVFWPYGHAATETEPGVATVKCHTAYQPHHRVEEMPGAPATTLSWPHAAEQAALEADIRALRPQVDVLIVYFHWGVSGSRDLAQYQPTLGQAAIDAGADVVVGSHPHVPQAVELYRDRAIFYSLGNFVFDWPPMRAYRDGLLAEARVEERSLVEVRFYTVRRDEAGHPVILAPSATTELVEDLVARSAALGTTLRVERDSVLVWRKETG